MSVIAPWGSLKPGPSYFLVLERAILPRVSVDNVLRLPQCCVIHHTVVNSEIMGEGGAEYRAPCEEDQNLHNHDTPLNHGQFTPYIGSLQ